MDGETVVAKEEEWRRKRIEDVYTKWERKGSQPGRRNSPQNGHSKPSRPIVVRPPRYSSATTSRYNRERRNQNVMLSNGVSSTTFIPFLGVDSGALHSANNNLKYISTRKSCQRCFPTSGIMSPSENTVKAGLFNFLVVDKRKYGWFGQCFPSLSFIWNATIDYSLRDLRKDVIQSKRVRDAIEECAKAAVDKECIEYEVAIGDHDKRAKSIICNMSSCVYTNLAKVVALALIWVFRRLFNKIHVSNEHISMLLRAQERKIPIVFLPGHKSHMDYIIMTFILFNMGIHMPRIAAGDNLRIPLISWLVTHLGGFFIKRKFDSSTGKDILYRKCLQEFMERSLCDGENMEFFIEGSRSRSGKPNSPKAGLLSVLVNSVKEGVVEDILLVPVGISYDMLIERNFVRHELMGGQKRAETFCKAMRGVWSMLTKNTGAIKIDFAEPFSLQEYLSSSTTASHCQLEMFNASHSRSILNMVDLAERKMITSLSHHIVHDITNCASLMSTNMVSFLLLTKHRSGVTIPELIKSYQWLEELARKKHRAIGFLGEASEAVHYAFHYLKPLLVVDKGVCDQIVCPRLELPDVFELLHHANQVTPMLVLEAVIACSLLGLVEEELKLSMDTVEVKKAEVVENAIFLCGLFSREFIFAPPCVDISSAFDDTIETLVNSDVLRIPSESLVCSSGRKLPRIDGESDEDDDDDGGEMKDIQLQVNTDEWALDHLTFLKSILDPFLESYWNTAVCLLQLEHTIEEPAFLKQLQESLVEKAKEEVLRNVESCSMDTLRNATKAMIDMGCITYRKGSFIHVADSAKLMDVVEGIMKFKK